MALSTKTMVITLGTIFLFIASGCQKYEIKAGTSLSTFGPPVKEGRPPWAPAHGYRAKHRYYYYPSSGIYFDVVRNLFFYVQGGKWDATPSLPANIKLDVTEYVTLEMAIDKPYEFHSEVVKREPLSDKKENAVHKGKE